MKRILTALSATLMWLALGAPAFAQVQGFPTNHPWFTNPQSAAFQQFLAGHPQIAQQLSANPGNLYNPNWRGQYPQLQSWLQANPNVWTGLRGQGSSLYNSEFSNFLSHHPGVARDLSANPELLYDPSFRAAHPELQTWLAGHPSVWRSLKSQAMAMPMGPGGYGAYDQYHVWRDPNWWHEHDPAWMWQNHPEWSSVNPRWRDEDGDYDDYHVWHYRDWWAEHHPEWVEKHHPNWAKWSAKHEEQIEHHEMQAERHMEHEREKPQNWEQHHGGDHGHHGHDHD